MNNNQNNNNNNDNNTNNINNTRRNSDLNNKNQIKFKRFVYNPKEKDIILNYQIGAMGLGNIGATCYMNATLQCFYHVKMLSEFLINDDKIDKRMEITYCYKKLTEELTGIKDKKKFKKNLQNLKFDNKTKGYIEPKDFKELISKKNPLFKGIKACDSKDLILFILEKMDRELTLRNNNQKESVIFVGNDIKEMEEENIKKYHNSILFDLFYGFSKTTLQCISCGQKNDTYSIINFLIFPLEKTYYALKKNGCNNSRINDIYQFYSFYNNPSQMFNPKTFQTSIFQEKRKLTLDNCFEEYFKEEFFSGDNQIYCNTCKQNSNAKNKNTIYKAPEVLILIINRGKGNIFKCDLDFPLDLDISKYVENNSSPKKYDLIGIISHLGKSDMDGHFIALCKHFDDNWYMFNDAIVSNISQNNIRKIGTPYILFYQNKDLQN